MLQHAKDYIKKCHGLVLTPENPVYTDKAYSKKEAEMQRQMTWLPQGQTAEISQHHIAFKPQKSWLCALSMAVVNHKALLST